MTQELAGFVLLGLPARTRWVRARFYACNLRRLRDPLRLAEGTFFPAAERGLKTGETRGRPAFAASTLIAADAVSAPAAGGFASWLARASEARCMASTLRSFHCLNPRRI